MFLRAGGCILAPGALFCIAKRSLVPGSQTKAPLGSPYGRAGAARRLRGQLRTRIPIRQREAAVPPAATFLFLKKRNMEKRKCACGRRIKSALRAVIWRARLRAKVSRRTSWPPLVEATGNRFFPYPSLASSNLAPPLGELSAKLTERAFRPLRPVCALGTSPSQGEARGLERGPRAARK